MKFHEKEHRIGAIEEGIHVRFLLTYAPGRKTDVWLVQTDGGGADLGEVKWAAGWRCYAFFPLASTLFDSKCLEETAE